MLYFPILSKDVRVEDLTDDLAFDPTIETSFIAGYRQTRARATFIPKLFIRAYRFLSQEDKELLEEFQNDVNVGADVFGWVDSVTGFGYEVRFIGKLSFKMEPTAPNQWQTRIIFEEYK